MEVTTSLEVSTIAIGLLGGLALFLYGMDLMTDALKIVAGGEMKKLLARLTTNRLYAVFAGTLVTAVIQSSSVTTVLVVGFISAGLMTLSQSLGVILGANIGTTITAQIIAFKITQYSLILVALGFLMQFTAKREQLRQYGMMIMGLGLIFFGMELMSGATRPLRAYQPFIELMHQMDNPLLGVLIGAIFTAIIQSSSATTGVIIVLGSQGFISLEAAIALIYGANIGTCATALLAAIGKPREAVQAAAAHVIFKVVGVVLWFSFISQLASITRLISPSAPELDNAARLAVEMPRQIANAHSIFNIVNTALLIWFTGPVVGLVQWLLPERAEGVAKPARPLYLQDILLETPEFALDRVRLELGWLGAHVLQMVNRALPVISQGSREEIEALSEMDNEVDAIYARIVQYLGKLSQKNLLKGQSKLVQDYMAIANYLENIGDTIETNLVELGHKRLTGDFEISHSTNTMLQALHAKVFWTVERALLALAATDKHLAQEVMTAKLEVNELAARAENHLAERLVAAEPHRLDAFSLESEMIEYLKRIYYFAKRIAKITADADMIFKIAGAPERGYQEVVLDQKG